MLAPSTPPGRGASPGDIAVRLITYREAGRERLGLVTGDHVRAAADVLPDAPGTMAELLARDDTLRELQEAAAEPAPAAESARAGRRLEEIELLAPVPRPGKIVAVGLNYHAHATEQGIEPPTQPTVFAKFPTSVVAHEATVSWDPELAGQVDYEAELAVVIGRTARRVLERDALEYVLGYTCANDVTARDLQRGDRQWVRGKSLDTFCPLGPVLVTADEIPDPQALAISCTVSGERLQEASTGDMIFGAASLIAFCSRAFTLEPGDVLLTGTPSGVGVYRDPQRLLRDGDEMTVEIERIGRLVNRCRTTVGDR